MCFRPADANFKRRCNACGAEVEVGMEKCPACGEE